MRAAIEQSSGHEVLFVCSQGEDGRLTSARPVARGNEHMVPAPYPHMSQGEVIVHNHPGGLLKPSDADLQVAARLAQEGIGSWIVDNALENLYVITEAFVPGETAELDLAALADMLLPGGALSKIKSEYEPRDPQLEMLEMVVEAFNNDRVAVCEAGTGVGKSLAYLIPAFSWVLRNQERVVVSTATINLQQQIISKDIPTVRRLFEDAGAGDIRVVLAKGRNQYLCANRLNELLEEEGLFGEEQLDDIRRWAETTETGDRSDLPFNPDEALWARINSDPDACSENRCRLRGSCFLQKARKEAAAAHIIVTNHHLLFADLAIRKEGFGLDATVILPAFSRLIIDEAHNIESAATSYFSQEFNRFQVHKYANMLLRSRKGRSAGIVAALRGQAGAEFAGLEGMLQAMRSAVQDLDAELLPLFEENPSVRLKADGNRLPEGLRVEDRVLAGGPTDPFEAVLFPALSRFQQSVLDSLEFLADEYKKLEDAEVEDPRMNELRIIIRRLEGLASICSDFRDYHTRPDLVYWMERRRTSAGDRFIHFTATPIEVGPLLEDALFEPYPTIVMTSATLSVNRSIDFWRRRVGLTGSDRVDFRSLDSPFDYPNRVLLGVPSDAPDPSEGQRYSEWLKGFISDALARSGGHALVLFTSYAMLSDVYAYCKPLLVDQGITCLRQGDDDRGRLMGRFRDDASSVLFATHSFWEGVDAPGDALQLLIICRLPFRVPTEPVLLARTEAVERRGGMPFFELSLPEAVMKLKQGFGRLMRRTSDRGVIFITDKRIVTKAYGRSFIDSLPPARLLTDESPRLLDELERVLFND
jgi:ATP-dependent DNA helicase DinG